MLILNFIIAFLGLVIIPAFVGNIWASTHRKEGKLAFLWVSGQVTLWSGFQIISVVCIFLGKSFETVCWSYSLFAVGMGIFALGSYMIRKNKESIRAKAVLAKRRLSRMEILGWLIFLGILVFLVYMNTTMTYADGDNAYYISTANITEKSNTMYYILPYTGLYTNLDVRHALAPFPIWIAYISRVTGLKVAVIAHVVFPVILLALFFALMYLLAQTLLEDKKVFIPMFMISGSLFVIFGDFSIYTVENFLIARSSQGKAVLGSIVIPFLIWILFRILVCLQEERAIPVFYYGLLQVTMLSGCLCSALSSFLLCLLLGIVGLCLLVCYRTWKPLIWMASSCVAPLIFAGVYFFA